MFVLQARSTLAAVTNYPLNPNFMKKRITKVLNFFAFNLLFFALYLNFIHKDQNTPVPVSSSQSTSTIKGTVLVENPDQYVSKEKQQQSSIGGHASVGHDKSGALKLSFN